MKSQFSVTIKIFLILFLVAIFTPTSMMALIPGQIMVDPDSKSYLVYNKDSNGDGKKDPFFLSGAGGPEGFLYGDITSGWTQDSVINWMISNGMNGIYMIAVRTKDGGPNQVPWVGSDKSNLDETKMTKWHAWFKKMSDNGIVVYLFFYDDGEPHAGDAFIRNMVNRFEDIPLLIWVVAEEYSEALSKTQVNNIINIIKAEDAHKHLIAVHQLSGLTFDFPTTANQFAIQNSGTNFNGIANTAWNNASGRYNNNFAELHSTDVANVSNDVYRRAIWGLGLGGAYHMQLGTWETVKGRKPPTTQMANASREIVKFFESTNFNTMVPNNNLKSGSTQFVLANQGNSYIIYSAAATSAMGLTGMTAGAYTLKWIDAISGLVTNESKTLGSGTQTFAKPANFGAEVAVYLKRQGGGPAPSPTPPPSSSLSPSASPFAKGDVNHDGSVNYLDIRMVMNNYSNLANSVSNYFDPVGDAKVNIFDAAHVVKGY